MNFILQKEMSQFSMPQRKMYSKMSTIVNFFPTNEIGEQNQGNAVFPVCINVQFFLVNQNPSVIAIN